MPGRDATGPMGRGAKTGRGLGNCAPSAGADISNTSSDMVGYGRGLGMRRGLGNGTGRGFFGRRRGGV